MGQCVTKMQNVCDANSHKKMIDEPVVEVVKAEVQAAIEALVEQVVQDSDVEQVVQDSESDRAARISFKDGYFVDPKPQTSCAVFDAELDSDFDRNSESEVETTVEEGEGDFELVTSTITTPRLPETKLQIG